MLSATHNCWPGFSRYLCVMACCLALTGCGESEEPGTPLEEETVIIALMPSIDANPQLAMRLRELVDVYLLQIEIDFDEVDSNLMGLGLLIDDFLAAPNTETMTAVRIAWLNAHSTYELTALHRYFAGLALPEPESLALFQIQYRLNHWPILPGYIDYVEGYPVSGIVHDITVTIDGPGLQEQHGTFDLAEAALGFHVLEFLLWGENKEMGRLRPPSDYDSSSMLSALQQESGLTTSQLSNNRRREYLRIGSQALVDDFRSLQRLWANGSVSFRERVDSLQSNEILSLLVEASTTMLTEEMLVSSLYPLLNGDYSDSIQSPYSHSTQNAISAQLFGVERLLLETRTSAGATLDSILVKLSADFEELFYQNFDASKECLVLLYRTLVPPQDPAAALQSEFEIVECINLLSNMIDHLEQTKFGLTREM